MEEKMFVEQVGAQVQKCEKGSDARIGNNNGFTTIEILIILALLVVLAGFFKEQIFAFAQSLFDQILSFDASMI